MAVAKTKKRTASVSAFLGKAAKGDRLADCEWLVKTMRTATKADAAMWGPTIVGFGTYELQYAGGRTAEWPIVGFSPRKPALVLYGLRGALKREPALAKRLGKIKSGGGCIYIKALADVDQVALARLVTAAVKLTRAKSKPAR